MLLLFINGSKSLRIFPFTTITPVKTSLMFFCSVLVSFSSTISSTNPFEFLTTRPYPVGSLKFVVNIESELFNEQSFLSELS